VQTAPPKTNSKADATVTSWSMPTAGNAGPRRGTPRAGWTATPPSLVTTCATSRTARRPSRRSSPRRRSGRPGWMHARCATSCWCGRFPRFASSL